MKRLIITLMLCLPMLMSMAQGDIQFSILHPSQEDLPASVADALELKLKQIVSRNKAASSNPWNVFAIDAELTVDDTYTSAGLLDEVSFAKGTLTLIMVNKVDGSIYHSEEFDVSGDASGGVDKALRSMVTSIKTKDPLFTRFIRTGRQRIEDYYARNCPYILSKAQNLIDLGRNDEALSYLSAISETQTCFEQAALMMRQLQSLTAEAVPDTVVVERTVVVTVPQTAPTPTPVEPEPEPVEPAPVQVEPTPEPEPAVAPAPAANAPIDCDITISRSDVDCRVISCTGNPTQKRITLVVELTNLDANTNKSFYSTLTSVIDNMGRTMKSLSYEGSASLKMPPMVKVRRTFYISNVYEQIPQLSYVEFDARATVIIRNLAVTW